MFTLYLSPFLCVPTTGTARRPLWVRGNAFSETTLVTCSIRASKAFLRSGSGTCVLLEKNCKSSRCWLYTAGCLNHRDQNPNIQEKGSGRDAFGFLTNSSNTTCVFPNIFNSPSKSHPPTPPTSPPNPCSLFDPDREGLTAFLQDG